MMHLTDLITPDELFKELTKTVSIEELRQRERDPDGYAKDVTAYVPAIKAFAGHLPPQMGLLVSSGAMTVLHAMEVILQRKVGRAN